MNKRVCYPFSTLDMEIPKGTYICSKCDNKITIDTVNVSLKLCKKCKLFSNWYRLEDFKNLKELKQKREEWEVFSNFYESWYGEEAFNNDIDKINNLKILSESPDIIFKNIGYEITRPYESEEDAAISNTFKKLTNKIIVSHNKKYGTIFEKELIKMTYVRNEKLYKRLEDIIYKKNDLFQSYIKNKKLNEINLIIYMSGWKLDNPYEIYDFYKQVTSNMKLLFNNVYIVIDQQYKGTAKIYPNYEDKVK